MGSVAARASAKAGRGPFCDNLSGYERNNHNLIGRVADL